MPLSGCQEKTSLKRDPYSPASYLRRIPPAHLYSELVAKAGEEITLHKYSESGTITVNVHTPETVNQLLHTTILENLDVSNTVAATYNNTALVKGVPE